MATQSSASSLSDSGPAAEFRCRCGAVRGHLARPSPRGVNRVVCYCDDCQAYAHRLGRADLLDRQGGSDIVQCAPARLAFAQGQDRIAGLRLSPKGTYRWYAACCNTPLGNTLGPSLPFVGLPVQVFAVEGQAPDRLFGKPIGAIKGEFAVGGAPPGSRGMRPSLLLRSFAKILGWRLAGRTWPHPFFDRASRKPIYPVTVLRREERAALRPLCGPHPGAAGHGGEAGKP